MMTEFLDLTNGVNGMHVMIFLVYWVLLGGTQKSNKTN